MHPIGGEESTITAATYMAIAVVLLSLDISYLIALSYHQYTQHDSDYQQ